jgi:hypothetical protein
MTGVWLISYIALWILFLVMSTVLLIMLRNPGVFFNFVAMSPQKDLMSSKIEPGMTLPKLMMQTLAGDMIDISTFRGMKTAFFIISPHCSVCINLLKEIAENGTEPNLVTPTVRRHVIVSLGDISDTDEIIRQVGLDQNVPVLVDVESNVLSEWGIKGTPTKIIVDDRFEVTNLIFNKEMCEV